MEEMRKFAGYLRKEKLQSLAEHYLVLLKEVKIPLKRHIAALSDEELLESFKLSIEELLVSIEQDKKIEALQESISLWLGSENPLFYKDFRLKDFGVGYAAQQKALLEFVTDYTTDGQRIKIIAQELSDYFSQANVITSEILLSMYQQNLQNQADVEEVKQESVRQIEELKIELSVDNVRLLEMNQELKAFAAVASHDLKAPLRGINLLAQWLKKDYHHQLDLRAQTMLDQLVDRAQKLSVLIDGILLYSYFENQDTRFELVNLQILVQEVIDIVSPPPHIDIKVATPLPTLVVDRVRMQQVFMNCITNAIKFIDKPKGKIVLAAEKRNKKWFFKISDNGPGIEPQYQDKVFQVVLWKS